MSETEARPVTHDINARVPVYLWNGNDDSAEIFIGLSNEDAEKIRTMAPERARVLGDLFLMLRDALISMHRSETRQAGE